MNSANDITEELKNMGSTLAGIPRVTPYSVPAGYFENLTGKLLETAAVSDAADPAPGWSKAMPYHIPEEYFDELTNHIITAVKTENIRSVSSTGMPFDVPAGYFEHMPGKMLHAAKKTHPLPKQTTHIPLGRNTFRQIRWAAAAVLLICIGFGGYMAFFMPSGNTENILASVPNNEIQDYLQHTYILDVNRIISNEDVNNIQVDNKDIIQYLDETGWDITE